MPEFIDGMFVVYKILALVLGAVFGSFSALLVHRLPRGESMVTPRSRCPACLAPIRWTDNIPVISYLLLRGRCRECRATISLRYPLIELSVAVLSLASLLLGVGRVPGALGPGGVFVSWFYPFVFCFLLVTITFIDLEHMRIPHVLTATGMAFGLLFALVLGDVTGVSLLDAFLGLLAGVVPIVLIIEVWYRLLRREGMGYGDAMLMGMVGATLGWVAIPFVLLAASLQGLLLSLPLLWKARREAGGVRGLVVPFGPFIALGALEWLFFSEVIRGVIGSATSWTAGG